MKYIHKSIELLFGMMLLAILALILFGHDSTAYWLKRDYALSQPVMLLAGGVSIAALCGACLCLARKSKRLGWRMVLPWLALLAVELVLSFHAYFITGWDVRGVVETAYALAGGEADMHHGYFSQCPNNIPITLLFAAIIRVTRLLLGNPGLDRCIYVLIAFQCVINTCTGMLCQVLTRRLTGSERLSWCVSVVYMVFVGLSPWIMIPYSDSVALIFPMIILTLYAYREEACIRKWVWLLMGLFSGLGYMIKPQVMIVSIAIWLVEGVRLLLEKKPLVCLRRVGGMILVSALLAVPCTQMLIEASPIELKPGRDRNMLHFVMMGLNQETNGSFLYDDVVLTYHAQDKHAEQMAVIKSRLKEMGPKGLAEHLKKKTLTNYADGSFAWSCEGEFYQRWIEDKDEVLSPFLKSVIYAAGSRYQAYLTIVQSIWLPLLAGAVFCALFVNRMKNAGKTRDLLSVLMLSLVGITLFQAIFEARARYIYLYAPFYVILGVLGVWQAVCLALRGLRIPCAEKE